LLFSQEQQKSIGTLLEQTAASSVPLNAVFNWPVGLKRP